MAPMAGPSKVIPLGVPISAHDLSDTARNGFYSIGANPPPAWSNCKKTSLSFPFFLHIAQFCSNWQVQFEFELNPPMEAVNQLTKPYPSDMGLVGYGMVGFFFCSFCLLLNVRKKVFSIIQKHFAQESSMVMALILLCFTPVCRHRPRIQVLHPRGHPAGGSHRAE